MKIKISKSQWENIGKQSGWLKTAKIGKDDVILILNHIEEIWQLMGKLEGVYKFAQEKQDLKSFEARMKMMLNYAEAKSNIPFSKTSGKPSDKEMIDTYLKFKENGRANEKDVTKKDVDPKELSKGIEVEKEHTTDKETAERISLDHLAEITDYYERLQKMEDQGKKEGKEYKR